MNSSFKKILNIIGTLSVSVFALIGFGLSVGYLAVQHGWTNTNGIIDNQRQAFLDNSNQPQIEKQTANVILSDVTNNAWQQTEEWATLKTAILKDQGVIDRAAATAGVTARLIVENLIAEQLRFFFDDRESYKKFFAPLKVLGSETQFSWGVMGVKEETAIQIEQHLADQTSAFYLGTQYEHLLDFHIDNTDNTKDERFKRMTDQHDHYYSYLYAGLYIKEIETQWKSAGFDISTGNKLRPDIIATLYNVGFANSKPNANPQSGGAPIPVGTQTWSFGSLAQSFYNSNELLDEFPK
jgi:hypothetical protein